jgi:hypothetical protein
MARAVFGRPKANIGRLQTAPPLSVLLASIRLPKASGTPARRAEVIEVCVFACRAIFRRCKNARVAHHGALQTFLVFYRTRLALRIRKKEDT